MNIRAVIRQRLRQAQSRRMCVLARNNNESALLHRLTVQGITCRPYPGMYAEKTYWNGLDAIERSRHICRTLAQHHPNMIFSSLSAAALWRLDHSTALHSNGTIYIASTSGRGGSYCNQIKRVHTASRFLDQAVNLDGAKSTDIFRTLFDCGRISLFVTHLRFSNPRFETGMLRDSRSSTIAMSRMSAENVSWRFPSHNMPSALARTAGNHFAWQP